MKLSYMSDLHLEVESSKRGRSKKPGGLLSAAPEELAVDADVVILAGDIHSRACGPAWAAEAFPDVPIVMVGGNHEPYNDSLYANIARNRAAAAALGALPDGTQHVTWLEREVFRMPGLRVLGATLWTDFEVFGASEKLMAQVTARRDMNDFYLVELHDRELGETRRFDPKDAERVPGHSPKMWLTVERPRTRLLGRSLPAEPIAQRANTYHRSQGVKRAMPLNNAAERAMRSLDPGPPCLVVRILRLRRAKAASMFTLIMTVRLNEVGPQA